MEILFIPEMVILHGLLEMMMVQSLFLQQQMEISSWMKTAKKSGSMADLLLISSLLAEMEQSIILMMTVFHSLLELQLDCGSLIILEALKE